MDNTPSEKAAHLARLAMTTRDMINPGSNPDRNHTRALIAAAFQRDAAVYYKLAIDLRLELLQ